MTTQLRLVEPPEPRQRTARGTVATAARTASTSPAGTSRRRARTTTRTTARSGRRAASWGDWHLDAGTRRVGRAGVAQARRALEAVVEQELSRAS